MGKEYRKGEVKDNPVSEGELKHLMLLYNLFIDGTARADKEGEYQEGDKEEGESCNCNCGVTVMVFCCSMIF